MSKRKDQLRAMFAGDDTAAPETKSADMPTPETTSASPPKAAPKRAASGAVKAMGLSLDNLSREADEAKRLRESIENAERVVELDPSLIEGSIIDDRLSNADQFDETYASLKASIVESGQQVPVLVRPHPDPAKADAGWFQAAYGHRRIRAALDLGIGVKAIVRSLDDTALLVAQGKENAERLNLSYIERAMFAYAMLKKNFDRATVMAALSIDKTEMSRMVLVAETVPEHIARAIGPAPKVGRPRWQALGEFLLQEPAQAKASDELSNSRFREAGSDERFQLLYDRVSKAYLKKGAKTKPVLIKDGDGFKLGRWTKSDRKTSVEISIPEHAEFAAYLADEMPKMIEAFRKTRKIVE